MTGRRFVDRADATTHADRANAALGGAVNSLSKAGSMRRLGPLLLIVGLLILPQESLRAEEGLINAVSYRALPRGGSIRVRPLDNSNENLILQEQFEDELRRRGYAVAAEADLILSFEVRDVAGAWRAGDRRSVIEFEGSGGGGGENARARLNIFDSRRGGLLNQGNERGATQIAAPSQFRMDATIDDRRDGKRLWQAWAVASQRQTEGSDLTRAMVQAVVEHLGTTIKRQPFALR